MTVVIKRVLLWNWVSGITAVIKCVMKLSVPYNKWLQLLNGAYYEFEYPV